MNIITETFEVETKPDLDIVDITHIVSEKIKKSGIKNGIVTVFVSGSTASISTMEFEQNLIKDVGKALERIAPSNTEYEHHKTWGDRNGKSHVRATVMGPGLSVPFNNQQLLLGTWQQLVLLDFDIPARRRKIVVQIMGE